MFDGWDTQLVSQLAYFKDYSGAFTTRNALRFFVKTSLGLQ